MTVRMFQSKNYNDIPICRFEDKMECEDCPINWEKLRIIGRKKAVESPDNVPVDRENLLRDKALALGLSPSNPTPLDSQLENICEIRCWKCHIISKPILDKDNYGYFECSKCKSVIGKLSDRHDYLKKSHPVIPILIENHFIPNEWSVVTPNGFHLKIRDSTNRGVWIQIIPDLKKTESCNNCKHRKSWSIDEDNILWSADIECYNCEKGFPIETPHENNWEKDD